MTTGSTVSRSLLFSQTLVFCSVCESGVFGECYFCSALFCWLAKRQAKEWLSISAGLRFTISVPRTPAAKRGEERRDGCQCVRRTVRAAAAALPIADQSDDQMILFPCSHFPLTGTSFDQSFFFLPTAIALQASLFPQQQHPRSVHGSNLQPRNSKQEQERDLGPGRRSSDT